MAPSRSPILFDGRWFGSHGIGRFARELSSRIEMTILPSGPRPSLPVDPLYLASQLSFSSAQLFFSPGYNGPIFSRIPYVMGVHDLNFVDLAGVTSNLKSAYFRHVSRRIVRGAARIVTVSEFSRDRILDWSGVPPHRVVNVGNGVDPAFCREGTRMEPGFPYLLYIGNQKPHKNLRRLVDAFGLATLPEEVRLIVSGGYDLRGHSSKVRNAVASRIVNAGFIAESDLPAMYRGALALVFPSVYEGFGLPALEAMACGTPVLTSNVSALPEIAGDAAILVDPFSVESIAFGIEKVVHDRELRARLASAGVERATAFNWDDVASRTRRVLADALAE